MKKILLSLVLGIAIIAGGVGSLLARTPVPPSEVSVGGVTSTSATVWISDTTGLTQEEKDRTYFEYIPTQQMCIMIYPTPVECLPKATPKGMTNVIITGLKPSTSYNVWAKRENTIACITTPCPSNEFRSATKVFTTLPASTPTYTFSRNLMIGSRGTDVVALQDILRQKGYLNSPSTGYYGLLTYSAVRVYQQNDMHISPTGFVGPLTRTSLMSGQVVVEETFTGKITAVSTQCFVDGICSVDVGGKRVITTIGWTQGPVGSIRGSVSDIGALESRIGATVKVYAKKTTDGYTLYGKNDYYIEVI